MALLSPGTRLGPYEILSPIGAGGMGEVYRARDPRMGREVAIKLSAEHFSDRFEREVRAVAALNHTNICQIYDVGTNYLVMELIEGPTLSERIKTGPISLGESLAIARQIGDALDAAHEKGIIHRDLKPANIKVKPDGTVKVLDFGLAKINEPSNPAGNPEESPTIPMGATLAGQIMGTAAYMAPEQARGKPVDKRVDIWAFGVVLYEMVTGRKLFEGETISDVLASVLTREPEWQVAPVKVHRLLQRCLEKDEKRRLRDIGDAWTFLEAAPAAVKPIGAIWKIAAAAFAAIAAVAIWAPWHHDGEPASQPSGRVDLDLGPGVSFGSTTGPAVILSPDGTRLVFVSQGRDGTRRLFTRRLDDAKPAEMSGTVGASAPFFSPDGQWVGFFAQGKLKKTRLDGGQPLSLYDAPAARGGSWGEDGTIVAALDQQAGLFQVPPEGGSARPFTRLKLEIGENTHRWPHFLPGGKGVLFTASIAYGHYEDANIAVATPRDHAVKTVLERAGMYPRYLPSGHLVYVTKGTLFAVPFDLDRLEVRGPPKILWEVASNPNLGFGQLDFARNGTLAYRTGGAELLRTLEWVDGAGKTVSFGFEPAYYNMPRLSPDGHRLAYAQSQGSYQDIWTYDIDRGVKTRLTNNGHHVYAVWTPDGRFVIFQGFGGIFWTRADGAGQPQLLIGSKAILLPFSFSPDGKRIAYSEQIPGVGSQIRTARVENSSGELRVSDPQLFVNTAVGLTFATFSQDGRWLAYANAEGGSYEVYVRAFPDNGTQVQISNAGGIAPVWSRNGREIFYRTEDQRIMVAEYSVKGGTFVAGKPRLWFPNRLANVGLGINFDLAPDGKRLIALMPAASPEPRETQSHVTIMMNFFDEVRRRMAGQ
jgi:eukaryotic-like serine/threonine-protein kinase